VRAFNRTTYLSTWSAKRTDGTAGFAAKWIHWREYRKATDNDHVIDVLIKAGMRV